MSDIKTSSRFDIRPGEVATDAPMTADATVQFIGTIHTPWSDLAECPRQGDRDGPQCRIELLEQWRAALDGLERFERIDVLYWLDRSRRDLLVQSPRRGGHTTGTFSLRSPVRPNPIGLSRVWLDGIDGTSVLVRGLDCLDGTPLIDLKPLRCDHTPAPETPG